MQGVADSGGKIGVGHGLDPETQLGPLVSDEQFRRVTGYLAAGQQQGARVVTGGGRVGDKQSGWGREMGFEAIELFTEGKAVAAAL
jgi:acyl-CoA reductase-like NAD-dependent aldehyde dehydrogenase